MRDLLEELYKAQVLTSTKIARKFFDDVREVERVKRFFYTLRKVGIVLKPDFDISSFRIKRAVLILHDVILRDVSLVESIDIPGVKSVGPLIPKGVFVVVEGGAIDTYGADERAMKVYAYERVFRSRPPRDLLFPVARKLDADIIRYLLSVLGKGDIIDFPETELLNKFDWIDLEIVNLVSEDPSISLRELLYKLEYERVRKKVRHFLERIERIEKTITGYGVSKIVSLKSLAMGIIAVIRGGDRRDVLRLLRIPTVMAVGISSEGHAVVQMVTLRELFHETVRALDDFCSVYGLELVDVYSYDPRFIVVNKFIRKSTGGYIPSARADEHRWVKVDVGEVVDVVRKVVRS